MSASLTQDAAFRRHHDRYLQPLQRDLEQHRRQSWRELFVVRLPLSLVLLLAVVIVPVLGKGPEDDFWWWIYGFIVLVAAAVMGIWCALPWFTHRERLKSEVLPRLVPFFGDYCYEPEPNADLGRYSGWAVLPEHNDVVAEDEVTGCHAGIPLRALELRLRYKSRSSGRSETVENIFKGVLMELTLAQPASGTTVLGTRDMFRHRFRIRDVSGLQKVFLEGSALQAWASDPDAAVARLKLEAVAKVEQAIEALGIRSLRMSWHDSRVVLLIDFGKDLFELSQRRAVDFYRDAEQVRNQLGLLTGLIDALGIDPLPDANKEPRPLRERMQVKDAVARDALDEQSGCLWMVLFPVIGFCAYAWLLAGDVRPLLVLAIAASAGVLAGVFLTKLLFHGGRAGTLLMFVLCLLALAPALPEEVQQWLPLLGGNGR